MNTFQLACFLSVATTLNFARAAEQMNVSQPTITHQIKSLEDELNVKLFRRSTRTVEITADGESFISDAKGMIAIEAQAKMRFHSSSDKPIETIAIGCGDYVQLALLSDVLNQFKGTVPNLHPRLIVSPYEQLFQLLGTERLDIVFGVYDQSSIKSHAKYKELLKSNIVCVCRNDHALANKESLRLKDLEKEALIFCDPMSLAPEMAKLQYSLAEGREPADMHFCSSSAASYVLAHSGFGIALLPEILIPNDHKISKINLEEAPQLAFGLYYKPSNGDDLIRRFVSLSKSFFDKRQEATTVSVSQNEQTII